jgi:hypothetical protein
MAIEPCWEPVRWRLASAETGAEDEPKHRGVAQAGRAAEQ